MKIIFKLMKTIHVFLYRLTKGKFGGTMRGFKVLLLTTTGRKTGQQRTTPLGYFEPTPGGSYLIVGSVGGLDWNPAWYYNIRSNPPVTIEIGDRKIAATSEIVEDTERRKALWEYLEKEAPLYADYQKKTTRPIPLILLHPSL
jgi:deazaflavin-dependent oxidoreductase (nitroreductase family)